jgi:hypothetical protein
MFFSGEKTRCQNRLDVVTYQSPASAGLCYFRALESVKIFGCVRAFSILDEQSPDDIKASPDILLTTYSLLFI